MVTSKRRLNFTLCPAITYGFIACFASLFVTATVWAEPPKHKNWKLTFSDEFNGSQLDSSKWHTTFPNNRRTTPTNQEKQWYVDDACQVKGGLLKLVAKKSDLLAFPFTSGMVASWGLFSQTYGYFEMRAKLPRGKGFWPAFWLLPADKSWPPEVDIFEYLGDDEHATRIYMTTLYLKMGKKQPIGSKYTSSDFSKAFHTYALEWEPSKLTWYIDSIPRFSTTEGVPQIPMYIVANFAVGGIWPGDPDQNTVFPGIMQIDYIRAYQREILP